MDFVATDPPYNVQLPLTMSGGKLAESFANRRTDYAMVTDDPADLANSPDYADLSSTGWSRCSASCVRVLRPGRYAVGDRARRLPGRPLRVHGRGPRRRARHGPGSCVKGDLIWYQAGTRLRPYGYPKAFVPNIAHQHIVVLRREKRRQPAR